ncbi:hypothetical protein B0H13DRAFT_2333397 [Mycena leptocephala]|nr:hypothetical protein B0H13DRAFT_2333397 [Mycena leptocephala]
MRGVIILILIIISIPLNTPSLSSSSSLSSPSRSIRGSYHPILILIPRSITALRPSSDVVVEGFEAVHGAQLTARSQAVPTSDYFVQPLPTPLHCPNLFSICESRNTTFFRLLTSRSQKWSNGGIVRSGEAETSDAEEESDAPMVLGWGQRRKIVARRYHGPAWEKH